MASEMIEWEKLFNSLKAIEQSDQVCDLPTRNLSVMMAQRRLKAGLQRAVKRVDAIMSAQVQTDEAYDELMHRLQVLALPVTVTRFTGGKWNHGVIRTKKGTIMYG
ncbi:hypothetical protein MORTIMER_131 [Erwinia phage vB_EamM_Mortimer]|uniref:Uncharacterized protein n=1 Tax=Erwinia phage vB_EamM_Mortimer TaxID=2060129 RepID=A0A2H5BKM8_9CAUD|nr:hypothetical protein MORTIMER_131 [Erwinia phage vB_EamM_Mortimer]